MDISAKIFQHFEVPKRGGVIIRWVPYFGEIWQVLLHTFKGLSN